MQVDRAGGDDAPSLPPEQLAEDRAGALGTVAVVVLVQPTGASGHSVPRAQLSEALLAGHDFSLVLIEADAGGAQAGRGLDLFDTSAAMDTFLACLEKEDPDAAQAARRRYAQALRGQGQEPSHAFGEKAHAAALADCERPGIAALTRRFEDRLSRLRHELSLSERERVALRLSAQRFYRALYFGSPSAGQLRRDVMLFALRRCLEQEGKGARAVLLAEERDFGRAVQEALGAARVRMVDLAA